MKIYRQRRPVRAFFRLFAIILTLCAILLVASFFWLQNFTVHTTEGIRVDAPFLHRFMGEIPASSILPYPPPPEASPEPTPSPIATPDPLPQGVYERVLHVSAGYVDTIIDWQQTLDGFEANAVMVPMNNTQGELWWETEVTLAHSYLLAGDGRIDLILDQMARDVRRVALLYAFHNQLMAERNEPAALTEYWLDPTNEDMQAYLIELALELVALGFDEIVLRDFAFPPNDDGQQNTQVLAFLEDLARQLRRRDAVLSVMIPESAWILEDGLDPTALLNVAARFYTELDMETLQNEARFQTLEQQVERVLGADTTRFIPFVPSVTLHEGNWVIWP